MNMILNDVLLILALFAPGLLVLRILSSRLQITHLETILGSVILSTSLLVFPLTIIMLSVPNYDVVSHFSALSIISVFATAALFYSYRSTIMKHLITISKTDLHLLMCKIDHLLPKEGVMQISIPCIIGFTVLYSILATIYPIHYQWDVARLYLPYAKLILDTSSLPQYPGLSIYSANEPLSILLLYSFALFMNGNLVIVPITIFICLLISIYLFGKALAGKEIAVISVVIFTILPFTQLYMSYRAMYLDLYVIAFMFTALYSIHRSRENSTYLWPVILGLSFSLLVSTRMIGILYALVVLQYLMLTGTRNNVIRLTSSSLILILILLPLNKLYASLFEISDLERIAVTIAGFVACFLAIFKYNKSVEWKKYISSRFTLPILAFSSLGFAWHIHNSLLNGSPFFPFLRFNNGPFDQVYNDQVHTYFLQNASQVDVFAGAAQFPLLGSFGLLPVLLAIVGIAFMAKAKEFNQILVFIPLLIIWVVLDKGSSNVVMFRHLGALAVIISLMAATGLYHINRNTNYKVYHLNTNLIIFVVGFLIMRIAFPIVQTTENVLWDYTKTPAILPIEVYLTSLAIISFLIFLPTLKQLRIQNVLGFLPGLKQIAGRYLLVISVFILVLAQPAFSSALNSDTSLLDNWEENYPEIIEFYNQNILDNSYTLTFLDYLTYFTSFRAIDIGTAAGLASLERISIPPVCNTLENNNIKYFLEPKKETGNLFVLYQRTQEHSEVIKNLKGYLVPIKEFKKFTLYEINCNSIELLKEPKGIPWNYGSISFFNKTSEQVRLSGHADQDGRLSILFPISNKERVAGARILDVTMNTSTLGESLVMLKLDEGKWFTPERYNYTLPLNQTQRLIVDISTVDSSQIKAVLVGIDTGIHMPVELSVTSLSVQTPSTKIQP